MVGSPNDQKNRADEEAALKAEAAEEARRIAVAIAREEEAERGRRAAALKRHAPGGGVGSGGALVKYGGYDLLGLRDVGELPDIGVGKDGVMSVSEAGNLEERVMASIKVQGGKESLADVADERTRKAFLIALRVYIALHASENADDGSGALGDGAALEFSEWSVPGSQVKVAAGVRSFGRYLRCRADEVSESIRFMLNRANLEGAAEKFPLAKKTARNITVNARQRHLAEFPHYAFVGAEWCRGVTPRVAELLAVSKARLLAASASGGGGSGGASSVARRGPAGGGGNAGAGASLASFGDF